MAKRPTDDSPSSEFLIPVIVIFGVVVVWVAKAVGKVRRLLGV